MEPVTIIAIAGAEQIDNVYQIIIILRSGGIQGLQEAFNLLFPQPSDS